MARISHAACAHPSNKVARAKCRRDAKKFAAALAEIIEPAPVVDITSPVITAWHDMIAGPRELTAAPAPARVSFDVTRENWRDVKGMTAAIVIAGERIEGMITGWSPRLFQYKNIETGKTMRIPAETVESVIV